jgi:hypothetical protein
MTITDPTGATPVEIDTELARIELDRARAERDLAGLADRMKRLAELGDSSAVDRLRPLIDEARQKISDCDATTRPLDDEFVRRDGWTRAFLVTNTGGHVHRSMNCRTCYPRTRFAWLTQFSGHDETEIVEQAGEAACTECYPTAPVEVRNRPSRIKTPEQIAREQEKAARAQAKAAKAITAPDGTPLYTERHGHIATEFTARREYADVAAEARYLERVDAARHHRAIVECRQDAELILAALAAKHSQTVQDMRTELAASVDAKWRRDYSQWS